MAREGGCGPFSHPPNEVQLTGFVRQSPCAAIRGDFVKPGSLTAEPSDLVRWSRTAMLVTSRDASAARPGRPSEVRFSRREPTAEGLAETGRWLAALLGRETGSKAGKALLSR